MRTIEELRVSAYAVCQREDAAGGPEILLARWANPRDAADRQWTMPGGGVEHGEDPYDTAVRELREETGYDVEIDALIGTDSRVRRYPRGFGRWAEHHSVRIYYAAHVVGGELRDEVGGSTDRAAWIGLDRLSGLALDPKVDIALELARTRPPTGRIRPA
jgi:8-oxo-dGTP diphosphatase